jgi:hypothetical protein
MDTHFWLLKFLISNRPISHSEWLTHLFRLGNISMLCVGRFEIRNFKNKKSVLMCSSYLVENFFLVILELRIFFLCKIFKKKSILRSIFRDFTGSMWSSSSEAVWSARRLIFWAVKIKRFSVNCFFHWGSATNI